MKGILVGRGRAGGILVGRGQTLRYSDGAGAERLENSRRVRNDSVRLNLTYF